jgi:hypothetical protein
MEERTLKMVSKTTKRNDKLERELKKKLGNRCSYRGCKRVRGLEFAHTRKTELSGHSGRGRSNRLSDVANHLSSYTLRCPDHNKRGRPKQKIRRNRN